MEKRKFHDKEVSRLGFGLMRLPRNPENRAQIDYEASEKLIDYAIANGVNYFDTAYTYGGSEEFAGHALSKYPRESYYLATKCPPWKLQSPEDFERIFAEELERCQTDYIDFFLVHNFAEEMKRASGNEEHFEHFEKVGMYEQLQQKKAEGKVRHVGFSFHGTPKLLEKIVGKYDWDFAQLQINYIDWTATDAKRQYEILTEHNIPVTVMEPLRGGALATLTDDAGALLKQARPDESLASWGLRYVASLPNVLTVLSGMNEMEQLTDNIATMTDFEPVTEEETKLIYEAATVYNKSGAVPCTGCSYCMPCPAGVNIPRVFSIYNYYKRVKFRIPFDNGYSSLTEDEKASSCVQCGQCMEKCPQHLTIPDYLQEIADFAASPSTGMF